MTIIGKIAIKNSLPYNYLGKSLIAFPTSETVKILNEKLQNGFSIWLKKTMVFPLIPMTTVQFALSRLKIMII